MFKEVFAEKKVVIFDLESMLTGLNSLYSGAISAVLHDLKIDWIYVADILQKKNNLKEVWETILEDKSVKELNLKIPLEQLITSTVTKLIPAIGISDELDVKNGFWELADELKHERNFKLVLKSEMDKTMTQEFMLATETDDDVFDLVVVQDGKKEKNLYKEIGKILKTHKISRKEVVVLESSAKKCFEATGENFLTIALKREGLTVDSYPFKVVIFEEDFSRIAGNTDRTYKEAFKESHKWLT